MPSTQRRQIRGHSISRSGAQQLQRTLPVRGAADLDRLRPLDPANDVPYVLEAVELLAEKLEVPLKRILGGTLLCDTFVLGCHENKAAACDSCHDYLQVQPYCWDCHVDPKGGQ